MMLEIYKEVFRVSGVDYKDYIDMVCFDLMFEIKYCDKINLIVINDLVEMMIENEKISEEDV